MIQMLNNKKE